MRFRLQSGASLRYVTRGRGRTIVLLHPVGLRAEFWDGVVEALQDRFRLIAIDLPGHGESDVPHAPFGMDDLAQDVIQLLRGVGQPPAIVAGCSMGGMIAQGVAILASECVAGLVIANTAHRRSQASQSIMQNRAEAALAGMPEIVEATLARWFDAKVPPEIVARVRAWLLAADPVAHSWSWLAIKNLAYAERLCAFDMPTLAVAGLRDQATPVAAMEDMASELRNCRLCKIDAGHLAPLEKPKEFGDLIQMFAGSFDASQ